MSHRKTDQELLDHLDATKNVVSRSSLKDACVQRLRDAVVLIEQLEEKLHIETCLDPSCKYPDCDWNKP